MNPTLPIGHRDPRTQIVPVRYLYLAAQLVTTATQDLDYWETVKVPEVPSDRVAFEELLQLAVFLPLGLVALGYARFQITGALMAFILVLPVMKALNDNMHRSILAKRDSWHRRDAGRYAFTDFMCKEFDLRPEDVTMKLVMKMCADLKLWLATATKLQRQAEKAEQMRRGTTAVGETIDTPAAGGTYETHTAAGSTVAVLNDTEQVLDSGSMWQINPATGLPMMDSAVDVHGNVFGMDNMDSLFSNTNYSNGFDTHF